MTNLQNHLLQIRIYLFLDKLSLQRWVSRYFLQIACLGVTSQCSYVYVEVKFSLSTSFSCGYRLSHLLHSAYFN